MKLGEIPYKRQSDAEAATRSFKGAVALCEHVDASRARSTSNDRGPGTRLVLAEHTGFAWDEVCILGPYTPDDTVDSLTGIQGAARQAHDIRSGDSINVLMFISEDCGFDRASTKPGRLRSRGGRHVLLEGSSELLRQSSPGG